VTIKFISCQTFAGGFDMGATQAGMQMIHKVENVGGFGIPNVDAQRHLLGEQWRWQAEEPTGWEPMDAEIVIGNPPCSGFSVASNKDFRGADSPINRCMWDFVDYVAKVMPQVAAFESVVPAFSREDGRKLMRDLREYLEAITGIQWNLTHVKHDAAAVGGSCTRRRYFWVAHRVPFRVDHTPAPLTTWHDAIQDLINLDATSWQWQPYDATRPPTAWAAEHVRTPQGMFDPPGGTDGHWAPDFSDKRGTRIKVLLEEENWGPGETYEVVLKRRCERMGGHPGEPWTADEITHHRDKRQWQSGYFPIIRWKADKPGHVIYGGAINNVMHPYLPRRITHREVARAMGFPDNWRIAPLEHDKGLKDYWGKGVTVQCGEWIGRYLKLAVEGSVDDLPPGKAVGDREFLYEVKPGKVKK
jgi:site-specific DNA-cytosine methylase